LDSFHLFVENQRYHRHFSIKGILRPSHVCFICGTLPTGTLTVCIPNLFPPKEKHNVGLLRFDDDHDHICYRFAQVRIFGGKSNVFKSLQYWTDSTIVLSWLQFQPSSLKTFVANRVSQMQSLTDPKEWCHVPSEQNPADILSRGQTPHQLNQSSLWWHGPQFLNGPEHFSIKNKWNPTSVENSTIPEIKTSCCLLVNTADTDNSLFERFSSFSKLVRVVAYILCFVNNMRTGERNMSRHLSCEELKQAHNYVIKVTQKQAFREDIHFLEKHGKVPQNSKLISLSPFMMIPAYFALEVASKMLLLNTTKNIHYSCPKIIRSQIYLSSQFTNNFMAVTKPP
jgi:hypothetical protein